LLGSGEVRFWDRSSVTEVAREFGVLMYADVADKDVADKDVAEAVQEMPAEAAVAQAQRFFSFLFIFVFSYTFFQR
jgi:hypothetical protein